MAACGARHRRAIRAGQRPRIPSRTLQVGSVLCRMGRRGVQRCRADRANRLACGAGAVAARCRCPGDRSGGRSPARPAGAGGCARRGRQDRRGRIAVSAGEPGPLRRRPRGRLRTGDGGERSRQRMRRVDGQRLGGPSTRHHPLPGIQLLRSPRALPEGARHLPGHRRWCRRRQHPQHDRSRVPLDGRQRSGDRHVRTGAGRLRAVRTAGDGGADPRQHRSYPVVTIGVSAGGVDGPTSGRDRSRTQPVDRHQPARRSGRGVHGPGRSRQGGGVFRRGSQGARGRCPKSAPNPRIRRNWV